MLEIWKLSGIVSVNGVPLTHENTAEFRGKLTIFFEHNMADWGGRGIVGLMCLRRHCITDPPALFFRPTSTGSENYMGGWSSLAKWMAVTPNN